MTRLLLALALLLAGILVDGCARDALYQPPPVDGSACPAAEARMRELGCAEYLTTPEGLPFGVACSRGAQDGRQWRADCIRLVPDCDHVDAAYATPAGSACP